MTRTILNWSELIDQYRGNSIGNRRRLKKWAEMNNPETQSQRYKTKHHISTDERALELRPLTIYHGLISQEPLDNYNSVGSDDLAYERIIEEPFNSNKPSIHEIFADEFFVDKHSIPLLKENGDLGSGSASKFNEQDNVLLGLLEMNLRKEL